MQFCSVDKCRNVNFGIDKLTRLPFCANHQYKRTDLDRRSIAAKAMAKRDKASTQIRSLQNTSANVALLEEKGIVKNHELDLWFYMQMQANEKICENCGKSLNHYNDNDWRGSQHHIVDKSPLNGCPSIATNPLNHLVLGKWCCHSQWHTSFLNASKMPVFAKAQEKFLLFQKFIAEDELKKVNPYLFQV